MSKLAYPESKYLKNDIEIKERNFKENRDGKIKHSYQNTLIEPMRSEIRVKEQKSKNLGEYLRYYKYSIGGHKGKANQDRIVCAENTFIVCDGHGPEGGIISSIVAQNLLSKYV